MAELSPAMLDAWEDRDGPVVLTTVDRNGIPNAIYATCVSAFGKSHLVVADNYFDKTRKNLVAGTHGTILFMTRAGKAYQVKGSMERHIAGPVFEHMKTWNPVQHPGHAAAVMSVEEVYSGAERLL